MFQYDGFGCVAIGRTDLVLIGTIAGFCGARIRETKDDFKARLRDDSQIVVDGIEEGLAQGAVAEGIQCISPQQQGRIDSIAGASEFHRATVLFFERPDIQGNEMAGFGVAAEIETSFGVGEVFITLLIGDRFEILGTLSQSATGHEPQAKR